MTTIFSVFGFNGAMAQSTLDVQGHRGCRGLYPENTVVAFIEAVKMGVTTLEMDIVISKDNKVVVSHDPYLSDKFCSDPSGKPITSETKKEYKIYNMMYEEISKCDCGKRGNPSFPQQKAMPAARPLLEDVIDLVEAYVKSKGLRPVKYNIETKTTKDGDGVNHPAPQEVVNLLIDIVKKKGIMDRTIIQSFDVRTLQIIHKSNIPVTTALLVFNAKSLKANLKKLGFTPNIYSPNYALVSKKLIRQCHESGLKIIPWTVNHTDKMKKLIDMGVDGIITDYPDKLAGLVIPSN